MDELVKWINEEINKRGWSQAELARRAGISAGALSLIVNGERKAGPELCTGLASAFGVAPASVFRLAGLLPRVSRKEELLEELLHYWDQLPEPQQRNLMRVAWAMALAREADGPLTIEVEPPGIPANPETCNP